ncbi:hypothetical protein TTHERM_000947428 (macronuclear) [Tetrahymena thermophila SB210]|uniref:Uncharacterized protein n=1 Tax=Tetrahymena thermophila (strain SB210) TaxID=312017 RepID=W7XGA9_TETTS|nr:hypothetical protein TTHERM_000947428 [Tetrahymena thermophila SB210]EWS71894.1 hypothetical protein TTHERM_000947428 [Tetrahymena thermophila SB210]|eukprot:XP_012655572.1 hypothetical protein TTHERM_000947428 [Tetrahymena thermophila SB210]
MLFYTHFKHKKIVQKSLFIQKIQQSFLSKLPFYHRMLSQRTVLKLSYYLQVIQLNNISYQEYYKFRSRNSDQKAVEKQLEYKIKQSSQKKKIHLYLILLFD